jgi:hypothetical protein
MENITLESSYLRSMLISSAFSDLTKPTFVLDYFKLIDFLHSSDKRDFLAASAFNKALCTIIFFKRTFLKVL